MLFVAIFMTNKQCIETQKSELYKEIAKHCDWLPIARYLKNEVKSALQYFHIHKLSNIKKNLNEFSEYLILLNNENCQKIEWFTIWKKIKGKKGLNNSISYFYDYENSKKQDLSLIKSKIETNAYETITLMQSIKWYLILTIDEFCNASPTRIDILRYNLWKKKIKFKT